MGNILHKKGRIPTNLEEENEPIPTMLTTWEKVLDSEKEEFEACKCSFAAKGNERCCKTIKDFRISREICCNEKISVYEDTGTKERFAVKIWDKCVREKYQNNEIKILTILRDIEGDFVKCVLAKKLVRIIHILHENGIIYADLKPQNIMIDESGNIKLIDFDHSYIEGEKTGFVSYGTPEYMAPEQVKKEIRKELDWYALGSLIWETLSAETPNEKYIKENDIDQTRNQYYIAKKISEMKKNIELEATTDDQKAALPFVNDCIRLKLKDRIDLDNAGADFEKVEFLKDVTAKNEKEFFIYNEQI